LIAALGDDARGEAYRRVLRREGVDDQFVLTLEGQATGLALIEVAGGENRIVVVPGANAGLSLDRIRQALAEVQPGDLVLLQLEIPFETVFGALQIVRSRGAIAILDPAPAVPLPSEVLALVDYLTPNQTEARLVAGLSLEEGVSPSPLEAARLLLGQGSRAVVQKAGATGSFLVTASSEAFRAAFPAVVVDTIGAGDAFNAGFALALALGKEPEQALVAGNAAGALSTRAAGAQAGLGTRDEWEAMLD
jgi:ribokinase